MALPLIATALGLAEFAPIVARWLGGPNAQDVAEQVIKTAKKVAGVKDPAEAVKVFRENQALVIQFQKEVLALEAQLELAYVADRRDARARDVALAASGRKNTRADIMVVSAALGLLGCLVSIASYSNELPGEAVGIISTIAGIFGACLKDAYTFEFGSSRGSKEKDATMATIVDRGLVEGW